MQIILILLACSLSFSKSTTPKVEEILLKHAEAMGGLDKWESLKSYQMIYDKESGTNLTITCEMPNKITLDFKKGDYELIKSYDGEHGYLIQNGTYTPMRSGEVAEMAEEPTYFSDLLLAQNRGQEVTFVGNEKVEGVDCFKMKLLKSPSDEQIYWINTKTFLIEQTGEFSEDSKYEGIYFLTRLGDYKAVDGYLFPYTQTLIPDKGRPTTSKVSDIKVNFQLASDYFKYKPDNTKNLIRYWNDRYSKHQLKEFSFVQETISFENGQPKDTSTWYEAIQFPTFFRIDFGEKAGENSNIYRNDSIYVWRKGSLVHSGKKMHESLVMEGSLYFLPIDTTLAKLKAIDIDISTFSTNSYNERPTFVIGAERDDLSSPQIWVDAEHRYIVRRIGKTKDGRLLEVKYDDFVQIKGHWIESWVAFYLDGKLLQTERYKDIKVNPGFSPAIFDGKTGQEHYWY